MLARGAIGLVFLVGVFPACNRPARPLPPAADAGRRTYRSLNCQSCHRIGDDGVLSGPDLTLVGFRKSAAWLDVWLKDPRAWRPGTKMPDPRLSDSARQALVDYLSVLKGEDWGGERPWNAPSLMSDPVERGHLLYARAGCVTCHGVGGEGGYPDNNVVGGKIPALTDVDQRYTKDELRKKIAGGVIPQKADPNGPDPLLRMPPWGEVLKPDEIDAVVEYLWTLKSGKPAEGSGW